MLHIVQIDTIELFDPSTEIGNPLRSGKMRRKFVLSPLFRNQLLSQGVTQVASLVGLLHFTLADGNKVA